MTLPLLDRFILNEEIRLDKKPEIKLVQDNNPEDMVYDADQIETILNKLEKHHTLLTAYVSGRGQPCSTLLLEINKEQGYLVIDEFCPKYINKDVLVNDQLDITGNNSGVTIHFISQILDMAEENGNPYYKIPFPKAIEYCQRRQSHRVPVSISDPIKVVFTTKDNTLLNGELRDLSLGGFSVRLNQPVIQELNPGDELPKCILQIPKGNRIVCSVEVRRNFENVNSGLPMMGVMFTGMSKQDKRTLQQLIAKLERDLMKHMKR